MFHLSGIRRPTLNWDKGTYEGHVKLVRQDESGGRIFKSEAAILLR